VHDTCHNSLGIGGGANKLRGLKEREGREEKTAPGSNLGRGAGLTERPTFKRRIGGCKTSERSSSEGGGRSKKEGDYIVPSWTALFKITSIVRVKPDGKKTKTAPAVGGRETKEGETHRGGFNMSREEIETQHALTKNEDNKKNRNHRTLTPNVHIQGLWHRGSKWAKEQDSH